MGAVGEEALAQLDVVLDDPVEDDVDAVVVSKCGCAFSSLTRPWVAQRVCPMPSSTRPARLPRRREAARASTASRSAERFPTARTESISPPARSERPAES